MADQKQIKIEVMVPDMKGRMEPVNEITISISHKWEPDLLTVDQLSKVLLGTLKENHPNFQFYIK